jgi:hypothetical protein
MSGPVEYASTVNDAGMGYRTVGKNSTTAI